jgi:hypothetical protein
MAAVFAEVDRNPVRARSFANFCGLDRIGFAKTASAIACFAQGCDVINIDTEFQHGT